MKTWNGIQWTLGLCAVLVLGVACKSMMELRVNTNLAGQTADVEITYDGTDVNADKLPANQRADVKFFDEKGNEITPGASGVGQGEKVPVPQGATHCQVSGASSSSSCTGCVPPPGGGGGGGGGGMSEHADALAGSGVAVVEKWVHVFTLRPDEDGQTAWGNVSASFTLQGDPHADKVNSLIEDILLRGPGAYVPAGVNVDTFVRLIPEAIGARLLIADQTQSFTSMSIHWNSRPFATMGGTVLTSTPAPNGWRVIQIFIPLADFVFGQVGGSLNSLDLVWSTYEDATPNELHAGVTTY